MSAPPVKVLTPSSTRSSARRAWFSASATCPLRSARLDAYQDAPARSRSDPRAVASSRIAAIACRASSGRSVMTSVRTHRW